MILAVAWVATIVASVGPGVVAREFLRVGNPLVVSAVQVGLLVVLLALTLAITELRPLLGYLAALLAFVLGDAIVIALKATSAWQTWSVERAPHELLLAEAFVHLFPAALMALTVVWRLPPERLFLATGEIDARVPLPLLGQVPWSVAGVLMTVAIALPLLVQLTLSERPDAARLASLLPLLPQMALFAAVNAAQEEFRFRVVPLALLAPVAGADHALLLSSVLFGLGHWSGHPSGPVGVVLAGVAGWLWGASMLRTRGLVVPWGSHAVQDALIFTAVALRR